LRGGGERGVLWLSVFIAIFNLLIIATLARPLELSINFVFGYCPHFGIDLSMNSLQILSGTEQTAAYLRERLRQGRWTGLMPGVNKLASEMRVNAKKIEGALQLLEQKERFTILAQSDWLAEKWPDPVDKVGCAPGSNHSMGG
jgi:hypothetical protein